MGLIIFYCTCPALFCQQEFYTTNARLPFGSQTLFLQWYVLPHTSAVIYACPFALERFAICGIMNPSPISTKGVTMFSTNWKVSSE